MSEFNYLRSFVELLSGTEIPPRFAIWSGISSILSALERRVWINQGVYRVFPNYFTILIAASGQKKSTAIRVASRLLKGLDSPPMLLSQKLSKEQLISTLAEAAKGGLVVADELATFINQRDYEAGMGAVLTTLWDCEDFEYKTFSRGIEKIEDGYLSILGATTVELLRSAIPKDAIGGGFTSRVLFIYEDQRTPPVSWPAFNSKLYEIEERLVRHLNKVSLLQGELSVTAEGIELFKKIYEERYYSSSLRDNPNLQGYENRRHVHLLKVATALMVSEKPAMVIQRNHIFGANELLLEVENKLPYVMELITTTEAGSATNTVLKIIQSEDTITREDLTKKLSHQMNSLELSKIMDTLIQSKRVTVEVFGRKLIYRIVR